MTPDRVELLPMAEAAILKQGRYIAADKPMFGAIEDTAPKRWGRVLIRRTEQRPWR